MVNKKYLLLAGLCSAMALQPAIAQESASSVTDMTYRGESYDFLDSNYYSGKKLDQYRRYMNHETFFPPKPNNQWEIGINFGAVNVIGDIPSKMPWSAKKFSDAIGGGVTIRKAFGYFLSGRLQYMYGRASGVEYRQRSTADNSAVQNLYPAGSTYYHNYRTTFHEATFQLVGALNNIRFHKGKNNMSVYGFLGAGFDIYNTKLNVLGTPGSKYVNANGSYDYQAMHNAALAGTGIVGDPTYKDRKKIQDFVYDNSDDSYETEAHQDSHVGKKGTSMVPVAVVGLGVQFRLGKVVSLSVEDKVTLSWRDGLDGAYAYHGAPTSDKDVLNYASVGLGFNIGNKKKNVAPLWWVNPLEVAYSELSDPRHMKVPPAPINDEDGDGVADQLDKCPGTAAGEAVDSHGCPLDTDGDGVPDSRDKQLITPTECQPVDADGVGKCPCPDGCGAATTSCGSIGSGALTFSGSTSRISPAMQAQLANLAAQMSANPTCKAVIIGAGNSSKVQQQRSWDRVNAVIEYMSEKHGIDRNRFIFQYGQQGDANSVMYRSANAGEEGPSNVAPPFPNLRKN
jgi:hypothetical protein